MLSHCVSYLLFISRNIKFCIQTVYKQHTKYFSKVSSLKMFRQTDYFLFIQGLFSRTLQAQFGGGAVPFSSLYRLYTTSRKQTSSTVKQNIWFRSKLTLSKSWCASKDVTRINNVVCLTFHDKEYFRDFFNEMLLYASF